MPKDRPEPRTLSSATVRNELLTVVGVVFALAGWLMVRDGDPIGWFVIAFFGSCALILALQLIPGMSGLRLEREYFEVRSLGRASRTAWRDVTEFTTWDLPNVGERVFYDAEMLPHTYGMSAEELCELMERFRRAA